MELPQTIHREMIVDMEYRGMKYKMQGIPLKLSKTPGSIRNAPPTLGENTDEILRSIGYDDTKLAELREKDIIQ